MRLINHLKDKLRTIVGIRIERELIPVGEKPFIGSNIVRENLRIRLKYPISDELWKWLSTMGWRTIDMRNNRRRYMLVPDKILIKLMKADTVERHSLHEKLIKVTRYKQHGNNQVLSARSTKKPPKNQEWEPVND